MLGCKTFNHTGQPKNYSTPTSHVLYVTMHLTQTERQTDRQADRETDTVLMLNI